MPQKKHTTNHQEIKAWVEKHSGQPAVIVDPNTESAQVGLRIDFPGHADEALLTSARHSRTVSWEGFFQFFDDKKLAFEYLEDPHETSLPDAYDFVNRQPPKPETQGKIDVAEADAAIRGGLPKYYEHGGQADNPHESEVLPVTPDDVTGEESLGGDTPNLESDDDITQAAADAGLLEPEDKKRLQKGG